MAGTGAQQHRRVGEAFVIKLRVGTCPGEIRAFVSEERLVSSSRQRVRRKDKERTEWNVWSGRGNSRRRFLTRGRRSRAGLEVGRSIFRRRAFQSGQPWLGSCIHSIILHLHPIFTFVVIVIFARFSQIFPPISRLPKHPLLAWGIHHQYITTQ